MKPQKKSTPISDPGANKIGRENNQYVKRQALKNLPGALEIEKARTAAGWVYIRKGKITKQVHPSKLEAYKADDWKAAG